MTSEPARDVDELAHRVIGAAIEVHRALGPAISRVSMKKRWR